MSTCRICGADATGTEGYRCSHCDDVHCSDHRLPENHDCVAFRVGAVSSPDRADAWQNKRRSQDRSPSKTVDVDENRNPSKSRERSSGGGAPDLNPDGTIAGNTRSTSSSGSTSDGPSIVERLRTRASRYRWSVRWLRWKAGFFLGLAIILVGLINLVTGDGLAGVPTIDFYRPLVSYAYKGSLYATGETRLLADVLFILVGVVIYLRR